MKTRLELIRLSQQTEGYFLHSFRSIQENALEKQHKLLLGQFKLVLVLSNSKTLLKLRDKII